MGCLTVKYTRIGGITAEAERVGGITCTATRVGGMTCRFSLICTTNIRADKIIIITYNNTAVTVDDTAIGYKMI